jgi:hypothetical protein
MIAKVLGSEVALGFRWKEAIDLLLDNFLENLNIMDQEMFLKTELKWPYISINSFPIG